MYSFLLFIHIATGFTALCTGFVAIAIQKGSKKHILAGRIYFWSMMAVAVSALLLSLVRLNLFLLLIALFSFYLTWSGYRAVRWKNKSLPKAVAIFDKIVVPFLFLSGVSMVLLPLIAFAGFSLPFRLYNKEILLIFGVVFIGLSLQDLMILLKTGKERSGWIFDHIKGMLAAYIATFTAFLVVNGGFLPKLVAWLGPTVLGTILIIYWVSKYKKQEEATRNDLNQRLYER